MAERKKVNSRAKGKHGEREAAKFLRSLGFTARRGQQFAGGSQSPDVVVEELTRIHFEVKYGYPATTLCPNSSLLVKAMVQSLNDCSPSERPVVLWKPKGYRKWCLTIPTVYGFITINESSIKEILLSLEEGDARLAHIL